MFSVLVRVARRENGQDMVEYALVLGIVTLMAAAAYVGVGSSVDTLWRVMNDRMTNAAS